MRSRPSIEGFPVWFLPGLTAKLLFDQNIPIEAPKPTVVEVEHKAFGTTSWVLVHDELAVITGSFITKDLVRGVYDQIQQLPHGGSTDRGGHVVEFFGWKLYRTNESGHINAPRLFIGLAPEGFPSVVGGLSQGTLCVTHEVEGYTQGDDLDALEGLLHRLVELMVAADQIDGPR